VPANAAALIPRSKPGQELTCKAYSTRFAGAGGSAEQGVISHYAAKTLLRATTAETWVAAMNAAVAADVRSGRLRSPFALTLQVQGPRSFLVPGQPAK